ncbi:MAG TPA: DUF2157 domain-containing protein [Steroidobacteraceae bacterium]|nr:DUF2157 domain-containing protein [Steroidobacteraceae bacterium]
MSNWQSALSRWLSAGLIDAATVERIRAWEVAHGERTGSSRLALIAFGLGGLLLAAGVLLFVAAHWDDLSPGSRFALVLTMTGVLHVGGAFAARGSAGLATTLHAVGTAAFGAGIFLAGQIFNIAEHWPGALMLWSFGAAIGLALLRDWPHVLWVAMLVPAWLWGEWIEAHVGWDDWTHLAPAATGSALLAFAYLAAESADRSATWRRALSRLGALALIPTAILLGVVNDVAPEVPGDLRPATSTAAIAFAWSIAIALPFAVAWVLRGRDALYLLIALAWALVVVRVNPRSDPGELALYALYALGAIGVVMWGLREQQRLAVNIGVLGFALAIGGFYFSSIFDKLGRSLGLIGMGVLFIGGGWFLERTRRRLLGRFERSVT